MKFTVCYTDTFSAAHAIKSHSGVGRYLHGHDFRTRVCAVSKTLSTENIAIDLRLLESALRRIIDRLDHRYLNEELGVEDLSMEYLAHYILVEVRKLVPQVLSVEVCGAGDRYCVEVSE